MEQVSTSMLQELQTCHQRVNIEFKDLGYSVTRGRGRIAEHHTILKGINGKFKSGHLTAILGSSGAGKSTLLNVLSGFRTHGVTGTILINGQERNISQFQKLSCYIVQDFAMIPFLTTQETLSIAADLKLGFRVRRNKKKALVDEILQLLGLQKGKNTLVGKLSGGEQKRLSIGVELLTNPPIMFFDEPTSGLDSSSSLQVISYLKSLSQTGRTVICTIHQPSSRLFEMFDDIYLLSAGQCLYSGPLDQLTAVFEEEGFICPKYFNRADFIIEVSSKESGGNVDKLVQRFKKPQPITNSLHKQSENTMIKIPDNGVKETAIRMSTDCQLKQVTQYSVPIIFQFFILTKRAMLCTYRDIYLGLVRLFTHIFVGLLLGAMCYDVGNDASKAATNAACIFFFILFLFVLSPMLTVLSYPMEAATFLREHKNNWYSLTAYYFSKLVSDLPLQLICPTVFLLSGYFLTGQPIDNMRPLKFWILCMLLATCGQSMGFAAGAAFDAQMGLFVVIAFNIPMILFSGFYMRLRDIADYLQWVTYVSFYRFAFEGGMLIIYTDRPKLDCSEAYCHFRSPSKLLDEFGMTELTYIDDFLALVAWTVLFQLIFFIVLKFRIYMSR